MAKVEERTTEQVRREIDLEREQLTSAVDSLRGELSVAKLRSRLPLASATALGVGFVMAGGIGATARLLFRRARER
jgi:Protein of unknown function (DUF3618)